MSLIVSPLTSNSEKCFYGFLIDAGTDDDDLSGDVGCACTDIGFAGYIVEMDPFAVLSGNDSLGTEDHAELRVLIESFKGCLDLILSEVL